MKQRLFAFACLALLEGCGTPGRPVGLPPPEYEQPQVEPWPPPSASTLPVATAAPGPVTTPGSAAPAAPSAEPPASPPQNAAGSGATLPTGTP